MALWGQHDKKFSMALQGHGQHDKQQLLRLTSQTLVLQHQAVVVAGRLLRDGGRGTQPLQLPCSRCCSHRCHPTGWPTISAPAAPSSELANFLGCPSFLTGTDLSPDSFKSIWIRWSIGQVAMEPLIVSCSDQLQGLSGDMRLASHVCPRYGNLEHRILQITPEFPHMPEWIRIYWLYFHTLGALQWLHSKKKNHCQGLICLSWKTYQNLGYFAQRA